MENVGSGVPYYEAKSVEIKRKAVEVANDAGRQQTAMW
jgi:hypothetical protein